MAMPRFPITPQISGFARRQLSTVSMRVSRLWTPARTQTGLWLDAADRSTITTVSEAVSEWRDKSGNGRHATQGTNNYRPVISTSAQNGLNAILFDGSNDRLQVDGTAIGNTSDSKLAMFVVGKQTNGTNGAFLSNRPLTNASGWTLRNNSTTQAVYFHTGYTNITIVTPGSMSLVEVIRDGLSVSVGCNGSITPPVTSTGFSASNAALFVGAEEAGTGSFLNGIICEIVCIASVASTGERQRIEGYLAHKWGLTANLPSNHPYRLRAP